MANEDLLLRQMPHSLEGEQAVLGSMLIDEGCVKDVMDKLVPSDFYLRQNREIFETIYTMFTYARPIDGITVCEEMQKAGTYDENTTRSYLAQLMEITPTSANVMEYVAIVRDKALLRGVAQAAGEITVLVQVRQSDKHYDYVFIDCPPSLGLLVINAMCAVTEMLIPIQAEYYALEGLGQLINTIGLVQEHFNPVLLVSTMLVTMFDRRTLLSREVYNEVKGHYPSIVLNTTIPRSVKISEAPSFSQSVIAYDPRGIGAISYGEAALEIAQRSQQVLDTIDARRNK